MLHDDENDIDWGRLDRYVRGVGNPDERAELEAWVSADAKRRALADGMRTLGRASSNPRTQPDAHRALARVRRQLGLSRPARTPSRVSRWARRRRSLAVETSFAAAGVGVLLLVVSVTDSHRGARRSRETEPAPRQVVTQPGQRARVDLGDGSHVLLSADSRLTVSAGADGLTDARREVSLSGEALFWIRHDSTRPFIVRTAYGTAEDLGTEFVVSTYPETRGMRLAVREGRVAIHTDAMAPMPSRAGSRADSTVAVLGAGDVVRVSATGDLAVARRQDVSLLFASADGALVLRAAVLGEAIPLLERWFGIEIRVSDRSLLSRRVSGTFRDQSAQATMAVIGLALEQQVRWDGNVVTLGKRVDRSDPP